MAALAIAVLSASPAAGQLQLSSVAGVVVGPEGGPAAAAQVLLLDPLGATVARSRTDDQGRFAVHGISPGNYSVRAQTDSMQSASQGIVIRNGLPHELTLRLVPRTAEAVEVTQSEASAEVRVAVGGEAARRLGGPHPGRALQAAVATAPGWAAEDNGLVHARGVDDGFLYVIDGVPVYERLDPLFGLAPDASTIASVQVLSGYIPPEYGLRSGGVIEVRSNAASDQRWTGLAELSGSSERSGALSAAAGGSLGTRAAVFASLSGERSSRFLDPVHPANLHNHGGAGSGQLELLWSPGSDRVTVRGGLGRSRFDVPHGQEQEDAGQDQRQAVDQSFATASWQRTWSSRTVSHVAFYGRGSEARLLPSSADTPLSAESRRGQRRLGLLAALTQARGRHTAKVGLEAAHLGLDERFRFAVTGGPGLDQEELSPAALAFTSERPFEFSGRTGRAQYSAYVQDSWRPTGRLSLELGVRYDRTRLPLDEQQWSPRLGVSYRVGGSMTVRGSVNRFYQPPQTEYLLLSSSPQARVLSPGLLSGEGGAELRAERQTAFELGLQSRIGGLGRLDVAFWHRRIRNQADPNVFFGTTVVFPNTVALGRARGLDVRLELPRRHGWSGTLSYTLSQVVQFGPINGGLFLTDEVLSIGPGTRFTPDHDQRHVASGQVDYEDGRGRWTSSLTWRYQSGTPVEIADGPGDLAERPGAERVDFERGRVRPYLVLDLLAQARLLRTGGLDLTATATVRNLTDEAYAFNFGNPFSGTHFGSRRAFLAALGISLR